MAKNPLSCGYTCSRVTLIVLNIIFLLIGIALFVIGIVFRFGGNELKDEIKPAFENIEVNGYDFYTLVSSLAIMFIVAGAVIIVFSFIGFVGAACTVKSALIIYAVLICICIVLELAGVILFFSIGDAFKKALRIGMKEAVQKANNGNTDAQKGVEYMFNNYDCCHVDGERLLLLGSSTSTCSIQLSTYNNDCYEEFTDFLLQYKSAFIAIGIVGIILQLIQVILSCWLCRVMSKHSGNVV